MSMERVLEGVEASRRAAWAQKYAADERIAELEAEVARLQRDCDECQCRTEREAKRRAKRLTRVTQQIESLMRDGVPRTSHGICEAIGQPRNVTWNAVAEMVAAGSLVSIGGAKHRPHLMLAEITAYPTPWNAPMTEEPA